MAINLDKKYLIQDAIQEIANLQRLGYPIPEMMNRANSLWCPLGEHPSRGWFLMLRSDLDIIRKSGGLDKPHTLNFFDINNNQFNFLDLYIVKAHNIIPGQPNDKNACYLVEFADSSHILSDPFLGVPINEQYNVRCPSYSGMYYAQTVVATTKSDDVVGPGGSGITVDDADNFRDGEPLIVDTGKHTDRTLNEADDAVSAQNLEYAHDGSVEKFWVQQPYSWDTMIEHIWLPMSDTLGDYPGLPESFTDNFVPENYSFDGMSAWKALNLVLTRLGLAIKRDLGEVHGEQYSIVQVGAPDSEFEELQQVSVQKNQTIFDDEWIESVFNKVPAGVRVCFHRLDQYYGAEQTTPLGLDPGNPDAVMNNSQWSTPSVHYIDVVNPNPPTNGTPSPYHHVIWDDEIALFDVDEMLLNHDNIQARANFRAQDFFRMLTGAGGDRLRQIFDGLVEFTPGSQVKGVCWKQDLLGINAPDLPGGMMTEIVSHPYLNFKVADAGKWECDCCFEESTNLHAPEFRQTWPIYPHVKGTIKIIGSGQVQPDEKGRYNAVLLQYHPDDFEFVTKEDIWGVEMNGKSPVEAENYPARLVGHSRARPVYAFFTCPKIRQPSYSAMSKPYSIPTPPPKCCDPPPLLRLNVINAWCGQTLHSCNNRADDPLIPLTCDTTDLWYWNASVHGWLGMILGYPFLLQCQISGDTVFYTLTNQDLLAPECCSGDDTTKFTCDPFLLDFGLDASGSSLFCSYTFTDASA